MSLDPVEVLTGPLLFFKISGLWPMENFLSWVYLVIFHCIFTLSYTGFKCINFVFLTDANTITRELFICLSEVSLVVKIINFLYYNKEMKHFLVNVKTFKLLSDFEEEFFKKRLAMFMKILLFQLTCCQLAIIFSCGAPFFAKEPVLPYPGWYPLDWYNDRKSFWIVYFYQLIGIIFEANNVVLLELFVVYLMIVAGAHLDILAMRLSQLDGSLTEKGGGNTEGTLPASDNYNVLIDSIEVHKKILIFQRSIEQSFSVPFFIQLIVSGIILCITSFQIAIIKPAEDIVNLIFYITFTMVITMEIFLPCYFGTENIFKSNHLTTAIYSSNWTTLSVAAQKTMITFMEGLMKPKILLGGKLFSLTLSTFLVICNRTYSLFAVLKNFMK